LSQEITYDAEFRPYQEVELRAKITGFLENMTADVGDSFKEGQVIAVLDVPELKAEIEHAEAALRRGQAEIDRAKASYEDAHLNLTRLTKADKEQPNLIAAADMDAATAKDRTGQASLEAAKEEARVAETEVKRLKTMQDYTQIMAPFTGVVTKRYADTGALIQAGTSGGAEPVVRFSQNDKLRAVFPVALSYVSRIKVGDPVEITIAAMDRTIHGTVARFTHKVETSTRTMDAEVDVPNPDLSIIPGIYAVATLKADQRKDTLVLPVEAVLREKGSASVYVINKDHKIEERQVEVGLETPSKIEILKGLMAGELVMDGSRALVKPGETVTPKRVDLTESSTNADTQTAKAN
jgi:RND family efflux transporter MFP subunit